MPRPPAEPARAARDGRRHAACRSLRQNLSFLAASGAPLVRSHVNAACSLASGPLGGHRARRLHVSTARTARAAIPMSCSPRELHILRGDLQVSPALESLGGPSRIRTSHPTTRPATEVSPESAVLAALTVGCDGEIALAARSARNAAMSKLRLRASPTNSVRRRGNAVQIMPRGEYFCFVRLQYQGGVQCVSTSSSRCCFLVLRQ